MPKTRKLALMALLTAIALTIFMIESQLPPPVPIPGVKLGLANIITLVTMLLLGRKEAGAVLAVLLTSAALGGYAGAAEEPLFLDPGKNLSAQMWPEQVSFKPDELLHDGDSLELLGFQWKVLETPGHTAGGICYYLPEEEVLLAGDTLFENSFGRTDLPTGSMSQLVRSIVDKLFVLPDDTMVYPGHGDPTTIGHEKRYNPVSYYNR